MLHKPYKDIWFKLTLAKGGVYAIDVVETTTPLPYATDDAGAEMADELKKAGKITLAINFSVGSAKIGASSQSAIEDVAAMLKREPNLCIWLEGHTDNSAVELADTGLALGRAHAVYEALVKAKIKPGRLKCKGKGSNHPIGDTKTEDGRARNRRVEIMVNG
ncbi:MAG: OmpA family protein [Chitinophagia bacterium]|nr:OmpA family protein [Chitinophagia bacterium]